MNKLMIVTDSCSDIRNEEMIKLDVEVVPMNVSFGDECYQEGINITVDEFYNKLATSRVFPKTSQPSPELFEKVFLRAKEEQREVLVLCLSSALSGTMQAARLAADLAEYEDHVHFVDTLQCLSGERLIVKEACKLRDEGKSISEIVEILEFTQALWEQYANCEIDMIKWAEEITGLNLHDFNTNKAKAGGKE